jgi:glucose-6-phosphate isomerase
MYFHQEIKGCFHKTIQAEGLPEDFIKDYLPTLKKTLERLKKAHKEETLPILKLPYLRADIAALRELVLKIQDDFTDTVILGTGGSSLGGQTFYALAGREASHTLHFMDNIDPQTFQTLFKNLNFKSTLFLVISKSGHTAETLIQFLTCLQKMKKEISTDSIKDHFIVITEPKESPLRKLAEFYHIPTFDHDPHVGGRFSALSIVGLFPAMIAGIDPVLIREGAARVFDRLLSLEDPSNFGPAVGAALSYALETKKGKTISVLMPYVDDLYYFSLWYRQLWAESLGKKGHGTTPVNGMGAVDQHSQLQLYLDGPSDKFYTVIVSSMENKGDPIAEKFSTVSEELKCFSFATMGDLMEAEQRATIDTLIKNQRPTRVLEIPVLSPDFIGTLMMHFILETIFMADLYGVDPFTQPAVEEGKILAKKYLEKILKERVSHP